MAQIIKFQDKKLFLDSHTKKIKECEVRIAEDFMYIGFLLWEIKEYQYYEGKYSDFLEYAKAELAMERTNAYNFIKVCEKYSVKTRSGAPTMKLAEKFKGFGVTQLIEMLSLSVEKWEDIKPEMTVKQIKEVKKELKRSVQLTGQKIQEELIDENLNELICGNCGQSYLVDPENPKQWFQIGGKYVFSCCLKPVLDKDIKKQK